MKKVTRRQLLTGAAAVATASAIPKINLPVAVEPVKTAGLATVEAVATATGASGNTLISPKAIANEALKHLMDNIALSNHMAKDARFGVGDTVKIVNRRKLA